MLATLLNIFIEAEKLVLDAVRHLRAGVSK